MNHWNLETEVRESPIHGMGRFACSDIGKDGLVLIIMGHVRPNGPGNTHMPIKGTGFVIECDQTYLNHSGDPNLYLDGQILFRAARDIRRGEELTIDYRTLTSSRLAFTEDTHAL